MQRKLSDTERRFIDAERDPATAYELGRYDERNQILAMIKAELVANDNVLAALVINRIVRLIRRREEEQTNG